MSIATQMSVLGEISMEREEVNREYMWWIEKIELEKALKRMNLRKEQLA